MVATPWINGSKWTDTVPRALEKLIMQMKVLMIDGNVSQDAISYYINKHQVKCQDSPIVPWFIT